MRFDSFLTSRDLSNNIGIFGISTTEIRLKKKLNQQNLSYLHNRLLKFTKNKIKVAYCCLFSR